MERTGGRRKEDGGGIIVESERGAGTTFLILLPREDALLEQTDTAPNAVASATRAERAAQDRADRTREPMPF